MSKARRVTSGYLRAVLGIILPAHILIRAVDLPLSLSLSLSLSLFFSVSVSSEGIYA